MPRLAKSLALSALANALSLGFAALVLGSHFNITLGWFVVAVVLFTALAVVLRSTIMSVVPRFARGYTIIGGLVLTAAALAITDAAVPETGFDIKGTWAWLCVTLIVWAAGVAYGEVDTHAPDDVPDVLPKA
ncbi:hypothetical protein ASD11_10775 [Aeromicrobium sp. Root495]|uniref:phage holin family protein n=1 Tax=Aeromicrobium sp. Root495 TaxID=1736550 RepID=UPI0006F5192C|nr:phage holin family protein [Aeromicrobium sp. Root495]KQY59977.1 hypothetical protein ASD11_10775 [Aeromicrobium sp. Root495]RYJ07492.1 MAG: hypothetical protein EON52_00995 [Actinomycetales bacterium]